MVDSSADDGEILASQAVLSNSGTELVTSGESVVMRDDVSLTLDVTMLTNASLEDNEN